MKVRVLTAPRQEGTRVVVLGAVLWPDHITLHAVCESDLKEITEPYWEDDQPDMFGLTDDLGTRYERGGAAGSGDSDLHVWEYQIAFYPGAPEDLKALTVTHIDGSVVLTP